MLAEDEMPGLMVIRERYAASQPLKGVKVNGLAAHDRADGRVDRNAVRPGCRCGWVSCNIFSTQDSAAAAVVVGRGGTLDAPKGVPVFAWKGETLTEYWWCTGEALVWPDGSGPDMLVDDGGDATLLIHKGVEYEAAGKVPDFNADTEPEEWGVILELLRSELELNPGKFTKMAKSIRGVSEETTTGVARLYEMERKGTLLFPAINVNDSVTKSKFDKTTSVAVTR